VVKVCRREGFRRAVLVNFHSEWGVGVVLIVILAIRLDSGLNSEVVGLTSILVVGKASSVDLDLDGLLRVLTRRIRDRYFIVPGRVEPRGAILGGYVFNRVVGNEAPRRREVIFRRPQFKGVSQIGGGVDRILKVGEGRWEHVATFDSERSRLALSNDLLSLIKAVESLDFEIVGAFQRHEVAPHVSVCIVPQVPPFKGVISIVSESVDSAKRVRVDVRPRRRPTVLNHDLVGDIFSAVANASAAFPLNVEVCQGVLE